MQKVPIRLMAKICKMPRLLGIVEMSKTQGVPCGHHRVSRHQSLEFNSSKEIQVSK